MVERSLSMREARGSIPRLSIFTYICRDDLGWLWGWTSNPLVVDAAEVRFLLLGGIFVDLQLQFNFAFAKVIPRGTVIFLA